MRLAMQLAALILLASTAIWATDSWSGYMVDSKCYEIASGNVSPRSTSTVDRDMDAGIRLCAPNEKTKSFAVVQFDWAMFKFDPAGNAKAANMIRNTGKRKVFLVAVTGEMERNIIKVESISASESR